MSLKHKVIWYSKNPNLIGKEEEILELHLDDNISMMELSRIYKCDRKPIINLIKRMGTSLDLLLHQN